MKVLVTGVLGFIGSHFAKHMLYHGHKVVGFGRSSDQSSLCRIDSIKDNLRFKLIYGDLAEEISGISEGCDAIVNFAAKTFVDHSIKDSYPFVRSNIIGTHHLLEEARRYEVKRFIQVSTDEVYGSCEEGYFSEEAKLAPRNPYAASKAAGDLLALSYYHTHKTPVIVTRTENNYGRYQHPQKAIPTFIKHALNNEKLPIYGDGRHRRMWLRVEDQCSAIAYLLEHGKLGEIYNIGGRQESENIDIALSILTLLNKPHTMIQYIPDEKIRPGHDRRYGIDTNKIEDLGWKPEYSLKKGLPEIVEWYKDNQWWLL